MTQSTMFKDLPVGTYFTIGNGRTGYVKTSKVSARLMTNRSVIKVVFSGAKVTAFTPNPMWTK